MVDFNQYLAFFISDTCRDLFFQLFFLFVPQKAQF